MHGADHGGSVGLLVRVRGVALRHPDGGVVVAGDPRGHERRPDLLGIGAGEVVKGRGPGPVQEGEAGDVGPGGPEPVDHGVQLPAVVVVERQPRMVGIDELGLLELGLAESGPGEVPAVGRQPRAPARGHGPRRPVVTRDQRAHHEGADEIRRLVRTPLPGGGPGHGLGVRDHLGQVDAGPDAGLRPRPVQLLHPLVALG